MAETKSALLTNDYEERKKIPIWTGVIDYFPAALIEVAKVSYAGNVQHLGNSTKQLVWDRSKSMNQLDTFMRHMLDRDKKDTDGTYHLAKAIWRLLAELQIKCEREGYPIAPAAINAEKTTSGEANNAVH